jgi:hypothetical protein
MHNWKCWYCFLNIDHLQISDLIFKIYVFFTYFCRSYFPFITGKRVPFHSLRKIKSIFPIFCTNFVNFLFTIRLYSNYFSDRHDITEILSFHTIILAKNISPLHCACHFTCCKGNNSYKKKIYNFSQIRNVQNGLFLLITDLDNIYWGPSWLWSYGSWIYNYLCNGCLSPLTWVRMSITLGVLNTTLSNKVCQWLAASLWFSPGIPVSSTKKTDCHDIAEIMLKVALNIIALTLTLYVYILHNFL